MEETKRDQVILILVIVILFLIIIGIILITVFKDSNLINLSTSDKVMQQIYSLDYDLEVLDDNYFLGLYDNKVSVVIDTDGKEVAHTDKDIVYENVDLISEDEYLFYFKENDNLKMYIFNGSSIEKYDVLEDENYYKPIYGYLEDGKEYLKGFLLASGNIYNITKKEILELTDYTFIGDYYEDETYYLRTDYLTVKNKDGLVGTIDDEGREIIPCKYGDLVMNDNDDAIVLDSKGNYGVIDSNLEEKIEISYQGIMNFGSYYVVINKKNKMAIYKEDGTKLTDYVFNYDSLIKFNLRSNNSLYLEEKNNYLYLVNNYLENKYKIEYDKHNLYIIDKSGEYKTLTEYGYGFGNNLYTYDENYNIIFYDKLGEIEFQISLENAKDLFNVDEVAIDVYKIEYMDSLENKETLYVNDKGEIVEFNLGEKVLELGDLYGYITEDDTYKKLTIYDSMGNVAKEISGEKIIVNGNYVIVDKSIYKIF